MRRLVSMAALFTSSCGFIGIDLIDLPAGLRDGGDGAVDGPSPDGNDAGFGAEAGAPRDAGESGVSSGDASSDAGDLRDASGVASDGSTSDGALAGSRDASSTDAQAAPGCGAGFANCDADPLTCETPLGTISNCAACGDVCPANGGTATCSSGSCATVCNAAGTYAVKIVIAVDWPTGFVNGGSGTSVLWARYIATQSGNDLSGTLLPCGFTLPDFALNPLVANELYQLTLPSSLFDHAPPYIAGVSTTFSTAAGFVIGSPFTMPAIVFQVGANLSNPASDPWPAVTALPTVDLDADGKSGVTANYTTGGAYSYPRANMAGTARADRSYTGVRFGFSASGATTSCSELNGSATFNYFDTHSVGCHISGGADCTTTQRDQLDSGRPVFAPNSATLRAVKIAAGGTCASVRAALP